MMDTPEESEDENEKETKEKKKPSAFGLKEFLKDENISKNIKIRARGRMELNEQSKDKLSWQDIKILHTG